MRLVLLGSRCGQGYTSGADHRNSTPASVDRRHVARRRPGPKLVSGEGKADHGGEQLVPDRLWSQLDQNVSRNPTRDRGLFSRISRTIGQAVSFNDLLVRHN